MIVQFAATKQTNGSTGLHKGEANLTYRDVKGEGQAGEENGGGVGRVDFPSGDCGLLPYLSERLPYHDTSARREQQRRQCEGHRPVHQKPARVLANRCRAIA